MNEDELAEHLIAAHDADPDTLEAILRYSAVDARQVLQNVHRGLHGHGVADHDHADTGSEQ